MQEARPDGLRRQARAIQKEQKRDGAVGDPVEGFRHLAPRRQDGGDTDGRDQHQKEAIDGMARRRLVKLMRRASSSVCGECAGPMEVSRRLGEDQSGLVAPIEKLMGRRGTPGGRENRSTPVSIMSGKARQAI